MLSLRGVSTIFGCFLVTVSMGLSLSVGCLVPYLTSYLKFRVDPWVNSSHMAWLNGLVDLGFAFCGPILGFCIRKFGYRGFVLITGLFYCAFLGLSAITIKHGYYVFVFTFGLLPWVAAGGLWMTVVSLGVKHFPKNAGIISGIINCGFSIGGAMQNSISLAIINPDNVVANENTEFENLFKNDSLLSRIPDFFWMIALVNLGLILLSLPFLSNPIEEDEIINDSTVLASADKSKTSYTVNAAPETKLHDIAPKELFRIKEFYLLWFSLAFPMISDNFVLTYNKTYGLTFIDNDSTVSLIGSIGILGTSIGKLFWGANIESRNYKITMCFYSVFFAICIQVLYAAQYVPTYAYIYYGVFVFLNYSNVGGSFVFPSAIAARAFGLEHFPTNFGILYSSQAIGSFLGSFVVQEVVEHFHWQWSFTFIASFCIIGFVITLFLPKNLETIRKRNVIIIE